MLNKICQNKRNLILIAILFLIVRIALAYVVLPFRTSDYNKHLSTWYDEIQSMGGVRALREQVGNYGILYQFLIGIMTYIPISSLAAYKALSLLFDIVMAVSCGGFVYYLTEEWEETQRYGAALVAYIAALFLPTVFMNSSVWAQCDGIYTTFNVLALWCLCKRRDAAAFALFGVALSFKLQAIFILPAFLLVAFLRRRLHYLTLAILAWYATCIPGFLAGRSLLSPLAIYRNQTNQYKSMSNNFPGIWMLHPTDYYKWGRIAILGTGVLLLLYMLVILYQCRMRHLELTAMTIVGIACLFSWTCVEFLPCMHERYSYCVEILLLILVCVDHRFLACLILEEAEICLRYKAYLTQAGELGIMDAAVYLVAYVIFAAIVMSRICDIHWPGRERRRERESQ